MIRIDWKRTAAIAITLAGIAVVLYMVGRYAVALFLPFVIAFGLALMTRPAVRWLSDRTRIPQKVLAVLLTLGALLTFGTLCYFLLSRLLVELQRLFLFLLEDGTRPDGEIARGLALLKGLWERIPFVERMRRANFLQYFIGDPGEFFAEQLHTAISRLSERVTGLVGELLRRLPALALFLLITVISCFYFAVEFDTVCRALSRSVPSQLAARIPAWRKRAGKAVRRYLRAYFLLFLLTLAELTLGFLILRVEYVFLLAFLTAVLDILPILGVGTVLLPFAVFSFIGGNLFRGIGLLLLYVLITVVRQIAEPHLVGKSLGLHPILMLVAFYTGWKLFGVVGVLLGPALALLIRSLTERREEAS